VAAAWWPRPARRATTARSPAKRGRTTAGYASPREHRRVRRRGGAGALLGAPHAARLLRRAGRDAGAGRGDRGDRVLPPGGERERRRRACEEPRDRRSEEHTSELQSRQYLVCRLLLEKKKSTRWPR